MTPPERQCGPHVAVLLLRQATVRLAGVLVDIGRLTLLSDYGLSDAEREDLRKVELGLEAGLDRLGEFEDRWRQKVETLGRVPNDGGLF